MSGFRSLRLIRLALALLCFTYTASTRRVLYTNVTTPLTISTAFSLSLSPTTALLSTASDILPGIDSSNPNNSRSSLTRRLPSNSADINSYYTGTTATAYFLADVTASATTSLDGVSSALKCWSSINTWRNSSAIWWNSHVAGRTWGISSFSSSTSASTTQITTVYPSSVSTYRLCDGSPRANARPRTETFTGNTTLFGSFTTTLLPTFAPQPCSLADQDCRHMYIDTNARNAADGELLRQCGNPAHLDSEHPVLQCLMGGGPVELIYFPAQSLNNASFCATATANRTNAGPMTFRPLDPALSEITTLGHTFTSDSVYLSFKTLYAYYDAFWDRIGPNFTDLIVPLHSTDISSHCGGSIYSAGTQLNYADLNWPVPASAYKCQDRCSSTLSNSVVLTDGGIFNNVSVVGWTPECETIWNDHNPVLALPTKVRDLVPEWNSCMFWNDNIGNFWFDPPVALQPADVVATATLPTPAQTTPAQAGSRLSSSLPEQTGPVTFTTQFGQETRTPGVAEPASTSTSTSTSYSQASNAQSELGQSIVESQEPAVMSSSASFVYDPETTVVESFAPGDSTPSLSTQDPQEANTANGLSSTSHSAAGLTNEPPALSVLTEALSTFASPLDRLPAIETLPAQPAGESAGAQTTKTVAAFQATGVVLTVYGQTLTASLTSEILVFNSNSISVGQAVTVSGHTFTDLTGGIVVDGTTDVLSALPTPTTLWPGASGYDGPIPASLQASNIVVVNTTTTLSVGGPGISYGGQTDEHLSMASSGLVIIQPSTTELLTILDTATTLPSIVTSRIANTTAMPTTTFWNGWPTMSQVPTMTGDATRLLRYGARWRLILVGLGGYIAYTMAN